MINTFNSSANFSCPTCNALVLRGSSFCKVCNQKFEPEPKPCALCLKFEPLKKSHAIPDSCFRKIKKNGQAILVSADKPVSNTQDSLYEPQLCGDCENLLSKSYEVYALPVLRETDVKTIINDKSISFVDIDVKKIQLFFLSIFWRAANSEKSEYKYACLPEPWNNELRQYILNNKAVPLNLVTVKISYLTHQGQRNNDNEKALKGIIRTPFCRKLLYNRFSFCFLMEGFFIEFFISGFGFKREGVINPKRNMITMPFINDLDIPEIRNIFINSMKLCGMRGFS